MLSYRIQILTQFNDKMRTSALFASAAAAFDLRGKQTVHSYALVVDLEAPVAWMHMRDTYVNRDVGVELQLAAARCQPTDYVGIYHANPDKFTVYCADQNFRSDLDEPGMLPTLMSEFYDCSTEPTACVDLASGRKTGKFDRYKIHTLYSAADLKSTFEVRRKVKLASQKTGRVFDHCSCRLAGSVEHAHVLQL